MVTLGIRNPGVLILATALIGVAPGASPTRSVGVAEAVPIYLPPRLLAEAETPTKPLSGGGALWNPGPERFVGWALRDLRDCLRKITGARHPLTAPGPASRSGVFVGTFDQFPTFRPRQVGGPEAAASADPEAFVVEAQGDRLFVLGKAPAGLMAAVYTLLDRLGCKWYAPGAAWEEVPERPGLAFDGKLDVASAGPSYRSRYFAPTAGTNLSVFRRGERETDYTLWQIRNRMGGSAYVANFHNDPAMVPPALFEERPELFALVQGRRNPYALSRANPDTIAMAIDGAVKYLRENEGKGSYHESFSVETNDGSPACEESLKEVGNHTATDLNYGFANQVAAGIERAGLRDKWVGMCSYSDHAGIPSFDLHPRVSVQVTTGLDFSSGGLTVEQRLDGLARRKCRRSGVYDYLNLVTWSLERPGMYPAADPPRLAASLKRWHEHGATTYVGETLDSWAGAGAGHYLAARLLWDVAADPGRELDAYYRGAYGPAAADVRALHEDWARFPGLMRGHVAPGMVLGPPLIPRAHAARWHRRIAAAGRAVADRPVYRARLNDLKRYYLYLNLWREVELDLADPKLPAKEERFARLLRYVGANQGGGAFHANQLLIALLPDAAQRGFRLEALGAEFATIGRNWTEEEPWRAFPPLTDDQIDGMFAAAAPPADGSSAGTFDPALHVAPADARPPAELRFPRLHGPPIATGPRQYLLRVVAPMPRLAFHIRAGSPLGGGGTDRTCVVTDPDGEILEVFEFRADEPARFELADLKPGTYTATFPEFGAEELTVRGGNTFGAVRSFRDTWGFNPMRRSDQGEGGPVEAYFAVPAGRRSLKVHLTDGTIAIAFRGGEVIASEVKGSGKDVAREIAFAPSDRPRIAAVRWAGNALISAGMVIEGVTLYSPDPSYVLFERLK